VVEGVTVVYLERGLKGVGETTLKDRLDWLVRRGQIEVLVNLGGLPFMDSSDLGRLIRAHISVRQAGGRVRLCHLSERTMALMRMSRLDTVLDIYATEQDALAAMKSGTSRPFT
jgi:anti-sigma B factor antagonist